MEAAAIKDAEEIPEDTVRILKLLLADLPLKQAVQLTTEITGEKKNVLYELALSLKSDQ